MVLRVDANRVHKIDAGVGGEVNGDWRLWLFELSQVLMAQLHSGNRVTVHYPERSAGTYGYRLNNSAASIAAYGLIEAHSGEGHPDVEPLLEDLRAIIQEEQHGEVQ